MAKILKIEWMSWKAYQERKKQQKVKLNKWLK